MKKLFKYLVISVTIIGGLFLLGSLALLFGSNQAKKERCAEILALPVPVEFSCAAWQASLPQPRVFDDGSVEWVYRESKNCAEAAKKYEEKVFYLSNAKRECQYDPSTGGGMFNAPAYFP